jgi:hypothetical protein
MDVAGGRLEDGVVRLVVELPPPTPPPTAVVVGPLVVGGLEDGGGTSLVDDDEVSSPAAVDDGLEDDSADVDVGGTDDDSADVSEEVEEVEVCCVELEVDVVEGVSVDVDGAGCSLLVVVDVVDVLVIGTGLVSVFGGACVLVWIVGVSVTCDCGGNPVLDVGCSGGWMWQNSKTSSGNTSRNVRHVVMTSSLWAAIHALRFEEATMKTEPGSHNLFLRPTRWASMFMLLAKT